jgi:hypothetical protein
LWDARDIHPCRQLAKVEQFFLDREVIVDELFLSVGEVAVRYGLLGKVVPRAFLMFATEARAFLE